MKRLLLIPFLILIVSSCNNLMDADLTTRQTFIKTFNGVADLEAASVEVTSDAILILGNMANPDRLIRDSTITVVIKTDLQGNLIEKKFFPGGRSNVIKELPNKKYLVIGQTNPGTGGIPKIKTRLLLLNEDITEAGRFHKASTDTTYKGVSITIAENKIIVLGSYIKNDGLERPYVQTFSNVSSLQTQTPTWTRHFDLINRNYKNSKSVHVVNNSIIWASAISQVSLNSDESYVSIPYVEENSVFTNYSMLGQNEASRSFRPFDIQQAHHPSFGFGVVGTRANTNQTNANMFFLRTDPAGNIIESSIRFYDAQADEAMLWANKDQSNVDDFGTAITATSDGGFVLAGHYQTGSTQKNEDILLIKVDVQGNIIWKKTLGGKGDENVLAIRETEDRGLLICGTNTVENVPSIFLIKTDKNGELIN